METGRRFEAARVTLTNLLRAFLAPGKLMPPPRRNVAELLATDDPAWPLVQQWIAQAKNEVAALPAPADAVAELEAAQVSLRSPMGAIVYHTGGLLIDHGWLRILGGGRDA